MLLTKRVVAAWYPPAMVDDWFQNKTPIHATVAVREAIEQGNSLLAGWILAHTLSERGLLAYSLNAAETALRSGCYMSLEKAVDCLRVVNDFGGEISKKAARSKEAMCLHSVALTDNIIRVAGNPTDAGVVGAVTAVVMESAKIVANGNDKQLTRAKRDFVEFGLAVLEEETKSENTG